MLTRLLGRPKGLVSYFYVAGTSAGRLPFCIISHTVRRARRGGGVRPSKSDTTNSMPSDMPSGAPSDRPSARPRTMPSTVPICQRKWQAFPFPTAGPFPTAPPVTVPPTTSPQATGTLIPTLPPSTSRPTVGTLAVPVAIARSPLAATQVAAPHVPGFTGPVNAPLSTSPVAAPPVPSARVPTPAGTPAKYLTRTPEGTGTFKPANGGTLSPVQSDFPSRCRSDRQAICQALYPIYVFLVQRQVHQVPFPRLRRQPLTLLRQRTLETCCPSSTKKSSQATVPGSSLNQVLHRQSLLECDTVQDPEHYCTKEVT